MKHVNGDMDDLFRRASEKYPLRTDSADWDRLSAALEKAPDSPSDPEAADKRRRRGVFWWFLLIPLGGLGYYAWQATMHAHPSIPSAITRTATGAPGADTRTAAGAAANGSAAGTAGSTAAGAAGTAAAAGDSPVNGISASPRTSGGASRTGADKHHRDATAAANGHDGNDQSGGAGVATTGAGGTTGGTAGTGGTTGTTAGASGTTTHPLLFSYPDLHRVPTAGGYNLVVNVKALPAPVDSGNSGNKKKTTASAAKKSAHAYVGILGAPDLSTVKFQSMKGVGSTFGILLGYSFNDRWAVESGLYLDRKRYYTEGEYFSKEGVRTYPNTNLLNVDGSCYMWEIPINLRYNFNTSPRMKWFGTAGLSTYLMTRENYSYQYQYAWGGSVENGSWNLKKPSQYWFSIVNISAGFEQRLGKIGNLRLEPYLRLPLSGIGTGRLPILSAGLNIGITRQLW